MQRQALVNHVTNRSGRSLDQARYLIRLLTDVSSETSVDIVRFALFGLLCSVCSVRFALAKVAAGS